MLVLGIESSCDETSAAVVSGDREILSNVVWSQHAHHRPYGGVVPEIAARAHIDRMDEIITVALDEAGAKFSDLTAVAVTGGPGLIGGVIVGVMTAKAIASVHKKPFVAVNHLAGHALTARLTDNIEFPYLLLLVSGGHCQILIAEDACSFRKLGGTIDDAVGEAFDKTAKLLGLPYPGGPEVEELAQNGNGQRYDFPRPLLDRAGYDFSFSGLKTAVRRAVEFMDSPISMQDKADICASFQLAAGDVLVARCQRAMRSFMEEFPAGKNIVVAGGVAANMYLRQRLTVAAEENNMRLVAPPLKLCTDNAAMIAWAGIERLRLGQKDNLEFEPKARWSL